MAFGNMQSALMIRQFCYSQANPAGIEEGGGRLSADNIIPIHLPDAMLTHLPSRHVQKSSFFLAHTLTLL